MIEKVTSIGQKLLTTKPGMTLVTHGPKAMVYVGTGLMLCSGVKAVLKTPRELEKIEEYRDQMGRGYSKVDDLKVQAKMVFEVGKDYLPEIGMAIGGAAMVIGGDQIIDSRRVAAIGLYEATKSAYDGYRARVIESIGEDEERDIYFGATKKEEIETYETKSGKIKERKVTKNVYDPEKLRKISPYCRVFGEGNPEWQDSSAYNLSFLVQKQNTFTDILRSGHVVTLNQVYRELGFPETSIGAQVGWSPFKGDDYVSFGIFDLNDVSKIDFINGYEKGILLDFNVAGYVLTDYDYVTVPF